MVVAAVMVVVITSVVGAIRVAATEAEEGHRRIGRGRVAISIAVAAIVIATIIVACGSDGGIVVAVFVIHRTGTQSQRTRRQPCQGKKFGFHDTELRLQ